MITSPSGHDRSFVSTIEILHRKYGLTALFSPEHGVRGDIPPGELVDSYTDSETGLPVYSLYRKDSKRLTAEMLDAVDIVVYDIQDVGVRYYTFISTMLYAMQDCAKAGKEFVVLDRINPLGGETVEGGLLKETFSSFVGAYPLCMRYALTIGELAMMVKEKEKLDVSLHIIPCSGWNRTMLFPDTDLSWTAPTMGIPRFETALLYAGMCLFEGTNLSEGRGTTCPFETVGAPFIHPERLADAMNRKQLPGLFFRPIYFIPTASKFQGQQCGGVYLHVREPKRVRSVEAAVCLMAEIQRQCEEFRFLPPVREGGRPMIDLLCGGDIIRKEMPDAGPILDQFHDESVRFAEQIQEFQTYTDPK